MTGLVSSNGERMERYYRIPLVWQMYGHVNVTASSLEEAIEYALGPDCPLPDGYYLCDSVLVDKEALEVEDKNELKEEE